MPDSCRLNFARIEFACVVLTEFVSGCISLQNCIFVRVVSKRVDILLMTIGAIARKKHPLDPVSRLLIILNIK